ncbi:hypothetical protein [Micromonospora sp. WMMD1082]|uniref:hypothetical protein n=1 Tax=Micromonospora sp. WMMD1082 TaxID=3016104 RepID=UPI002417CCD5|nr:hypothetical protein [Micromonospora sp. WMMD1082]MDG4794563.1 hypothetical protein [Micromonospora sp. WMMD1082]
MTRMNANGHCHSFNGDGKPDIMARRISTGELFVFPHSGRLQGTSTFGDPVKIADGFEVDRYVLLRTIDISGEGRAHVLAVAGQDNPEPRGLFLYYNKKGLAGTDTLAPPIRISGRRSDKSWETLGIADLNGDGIEDMFGRGTDRGDVDAFLNRAVGMVEHETMDKNNILMTTVQVDDFPIGMADFTGTGTLDLLVLRPGGNLEIYEFPPGQPADRPPSGDDGTWHTVGTGWDRMEFITITDIDLDGNPDVLGLEADGTLSAYVHNGKFDADRPLETFQPPQTVLTGLRDFTSIG